MTDEEYVRSKWSYVWQNQRTKEPRIDSNMFHDWSEAAAYTREREEQIRQVEEEILWIEAESSMSDGYPYPEALRILAREQAALAELKRGMK